MKILIDEIDVKIYGVEVLAMYTVLQKFCGMFHILDDFQADTEPPIDSGGDFYNYFSSNNMPKVQQRQPSRWPVPVSKYFSSQMAEIKQYLSTKIDEVLDSQISWLHSIKCNPKTPGVFSPILKFPSFLDSLLEVFSTQIKGYIDDFYSKLTTSILEWVESIIISNPKYAEVVRVSNFAYLIEALG